MKNNEKNNGKVTEMYGIAPGQDMWVMVNQFLAHKNRVNTKLYFGSDGGIDKPFEKGKNNAMTYAELTGTDADIQNYINALSVDGSGKKMAVFEKCQ